MRRPQKELMEDISAADKSRPLRCPRVRVLAVRGFADTANQNGKG
jgi:hypothetical protein